jgi:hypothetical protein
MVCQDPIETVHQAKCELEHMMQVLEKAKIRIMVSAHYLSDVASV